MKFLKKPLGIALCVFMLASNLSYAQTQDSNNVVSENQVGIEVKSDEVSKDSDNSQNIDDGKDIKNDENSSKESLDSKKNDEDSSKDSLDSKKNDENSSKDSVDSKSNDADLSKDDKASSSDNKNKESADFIKAVKNIVDATNKKNEALLKAANKSIVENSFMQDVPVLKSAAIKQINKLNCIVNLETGNVVNYSETKDGFIKFDNKVFAIDEKDNSLKTGLFDKNGNTYFGTFNGLHRGWKYVGNDLYYFDPAEYYAYKGGIRSTLTGVFWFNDKGHITTGKRPSGINKKITYKNTDSAYHTIIYTDWRYPTKEERSNDFLKNKNLDRMMKGQQIANIAAKYDHLPFNWFGVNLDDSTGVYCCGLSYSAYEKAGIRIPGKSECDIYADDGHEMVKAQYMLANKFGGEHVKPDINSLQPGDIMIMPVPGVRKYSHVMLYLGKNNGRPIIIHASHKHGLNISVYPYKPTTQFVAVRYY